MGETNRRNIELYVAMGELMQHGEATCQALEELGDRPLARGLRVALVALVAALAEGERGRGRAEDLTGLVQNELDAAFRRLGIRGALVRAVAALERVQLRLWIPAERDGPPRVVRRAPVEDTQLLPVALPTA